MNPLSDSVCAGLVWVIPRGRPCHWKRMLWAGYNDLVSSGNVGQRTCAHEDRHEKTRAQAGHGLVQ